MSHDGGDADDAGFDGHDRGGRAGPVVGRRIVIWGPTGAGKSTLARRLAHELDLTRVELDALRHARGWDSVGFDEMRATLAHRLDEAGDGWVVEGNYSRVHRVLLPRIDTLILLDLPLHMTLPRLVRRTLTRVWSGDALYIPGGPRERLWTQLFSPRQSLWWYAVRTHAEKSARRRRLAGELPARVRVHVLTTPDAVSAFTDAVTRPRSEMQAAAGRSC